MVASYSSVTRYAVSPDTSRQLEDPKMPHASAHSPPFPPDCGNIDAVHVWLNYVCKLFENATLYGRCAVFHNQTIETHGDHRLRNLVPIMQASREPQADTVAAAVPPPAPTPATEEDVPPPVPPSAGPIDANTPTADVRYYIRNLTQAQWALPIALPLPPPDSLCSDAVPAR